MRSPRARSSSPLSCLAAALMPHSRGSRSRNKPCSELRRPGRPRSWVCPGSFTQSATPIKVSCPSRSEVVQFQRGFIEHTKIRPGQISSLSSPSPHLSPPPYHSPFFPPPPYCQPALHACLRPRPISPLRVQCVCVYVYVCVCVRVSDCTSYDGTRRVRLDVSSFAHQLPVCQPICTELKESWRCSEPGARDTGEGSTLPTPALHPSSSKQQQQQQQRHHQQLNSPPLLRIGTLSAA